ncbi:MAG: type II secretion system protein GspK [Planctomycetota bacterium]|jgi:hypothetical protein
MKVITNKSPGNLANSQARSGIVLLVTLVLLVVLSMLCYTLTGRLSARQHRDRYIIDYQMARYGCESAVKYASARLEDIKPRLIARPNEPDFSDLFALSEDQYEQLLAEWDVNKTLTRQKDYVSNSNKDSNYMSETNEPWNFGDVNDSNSSKVRGPYGPPWPLVTEPVEFKFGSATVKIEIEDENAKYPLGWAMVSGQDVQREALAGFETFCEWMNIDRTEIESLKAQIKEINKIKPFKLGNKPVTVTETKVTQQTTKTKRGGRKTTRPVRKTKKKTIPASTHTKDFAKLFHSSLIDTELLARPTVISESRKESALKYMGVWGSSKVNINTAPRQVLEAAFTFGGDADKIAEEIIQRRRIKPFQDIKDLKQALFRYSDLIDQCERYITTVSNFFTIKVTAVSGVAKASAVIAITKDNRGTRRIAVISG